MRLETFSNPDVFVDLHNEWTALLHDSQANEIFLTPQWQRAWWEAYQPGDLWIIAARGDDDQLVGLAPWFIQERQGRRVVRAVGCVDVTDYLEIVIRNGYEQAFCAALVTFVASNDSQYDLIDLCNIPQESPALIHLPDLFRECGFEVEVKRQDVCPVIELPDAWDAYLQLLSKKQRHEIRRKLRRVTGAPEKVEWYIVGPEHDLAEETEKFLTLMAASSAEKATFLEDEQNITFFKELVPLVMEAGWLQLAVLTVNDQAAAAYLNFDYANRILVYNSGQDVAQFGHLSPGIVLLARTIRNAIEQGREVFDFLRGDEHYKYQMGGTDTEVFMLMAERAR